MASHSKEAMDPKVKAAKLIERKMTSAKARIEKYKALIEEDKTLLISLKEEAKKLK